MKYQVGDRVLLLHSNEEGEVVDIINTKMVLVDVGGVHFPVYADQIDFPYFRRFTEKKSPQKEKRYVDDVRKEKETRPRVADGVWISFLPVSSADEFGDEVIEELKIHLVNRTETAYRFSYTLRYFGRPEFELKNDLFPFQDFYLHDIPFENLNDSPVFEFEFSLLQPQKGKAENTQASLKLKPKQLFARFEEMKMKGDASFSHRLFARYPDRETGLGELILPVGARSNAFNTARAREHLEPPRSVVDLHIDKITSDWEHLSNREILSLQLKTFEKYYDLAVAHLQPSLVVIHGLGTGRLREEIHELLKHRREVKSFVNQYHPLYGYGATEIYLEY
ncbi:MAG TPA: Smr/MutS family protein [Chitinophagaceae bacterium]|nr:Smr/MutS family protein [Chitinophagaceae bacterium]